MKKQLWLCALAGTLPLFAEGFAQPKFVPDISLITDFSFVSRSEESHTIEGLSVPGLSHEHGDDGHDHDEINAASGFNLNYAELGIRADADPYFDLTGIFHLSEEGFEIEEGYVTAKALPAGLGLKAGKFLSGFGRLNEQHHHVWAFADQPLIYKTLLGDHGLNEKGVQLTYLPNAPHYLKLGVEVLQGENENSFGLDEVELDDGTDTRTIEAADAPGVGVFYLKGAWDVSDLTVMAGLSHARGKTRQGDSEDALSADTALNGAELTLFYPLAAQSSLSWQSEFLARKQDGYEYTVTTREKITKDQAGYYTQLLWQMNSRWRTGVRLDAVTRNKVEIGGVDEGYADDLKVKTAMIEYNPTEFSRLRLQAGRDESLYDENGRQKTVDTLLLQLNVSIGAHGAHAF